MEDIWENFKCQRCGKCCTELGLSYDGESFFQIADHLGQTVDQVIEKYYGNFINDEEWESDKEKRIPCQFLKFISNKATCSIYSVRPDGCRAYPLSTDFGRNGVDCPAAKKYYDE